MRTPTTISPLVELREVSKIYSTASGDVCALKEFSACFARGSFVGVIGRSGAGKSTLVNMITGIDQVTHGEVWIEGTSVHALAEDEISHWRGVHVGVIYQTFELLSQLTVLENVMLPMDFCGVIPRRQRRQRAMELLEQVELGNHAHKSPAMVSGGQQQRVAIARALANDPRLIVADEPTGSLDTQTSDTILRIFESFIERGKTVIMVTHDRTLIPRFDHEIELDDGRIAKSVVHPNVHPKRMAYAAG